MAPLGNWPVELEVPVAWGDMDAFEHVNNAVYLRWFESARIAYFERVGVTDSMKTDKIGPILARTSCDFKKALAYPDTVRVAATVTKLGGSSFTMSYRVTSRENDWAIAAEGEDIVVMLDYGTGAKVALSDELRDRIAILEGESHASTL